jgi:hypothetical protein
MTLLLKHLYNQVKSSWLNATFSNGMIYLFHNRHSSMDCQTRYIAKRILAPVLNWDLPSMALDTGFTAGMTDLHFNLAKKNTPNEE